VRVAGQHIEREARYESTRLTTDQRDQTIWNLHRRGWTQRQIAKHLKMTQPAVKYAIDRLADKKRRRDSYEVCDGCGASFAKNKIDRDGLCRDCRPEGRQ
jgi:DNA-binding NarL/FixJ family response regulator